MSEKPVLKLAPPYDHDLVRSIEDGFSDMLGFEVRFEVVETPSLLSGFIAYVHGVVYDASGKTQLSGIQKHLLDSVLAPAPAGEEGTDS